MDLFCTRPGCRRPSNPSPELDDPATLRASRGKFCSQCRMPLMLLDRYLPTKLLGQGGFGAAYLARDRYTPGQRPCVVKQFQPSGQLNADQLKLAHNLFVREAEILEEIGREHPQIPDLFAFFEIDVPGQASGSTETYFYLVQEFIDGQDLEQSLNQRGAFKEEEVQEILRSLLPVLEFVHNHQVIHRDIKPSNIMRDKRGKLYLLDFGAIRKIATGPEARKSTSIFSPGYASPEQMAGNEVFPSSDLYALAVTCVVLLTNKEPGALFDPIDLTWSWQKFIPTVPVDPNLAAVLDRMLARRPSDRYSNAQDVLRDLDPRPIYSTTQIQPPSPVPPNPQPTPPASVTVAPPPPIPVAPPPPVPLAPPRSAPPAPVVPPAPPRSNIPAFSSLELLGNAAFMGFEGALLALTIYRFPLLSGLPLPFKAILWLSLAGVLVYLQSRRTIERVDLILIAGITAVVLYFLRILNFAVLPYIIFVSLAAIAITTLFLLIYRLMKSFL